MKRRKRKTSIVKIWCRRGKRLARLEDIDTGNGLPNILNKRQKTSRKPEQKPAEKEANKDNLSILDLPDECIVMILEKLNLLPHETCQIMKVCKKFYEVSFSPRLWRIADFKFNTYLLTNRLIFLDISQERSPYISDFQRRKMFAKFLVKRKAMLSHLRITFDIDKEMDTFRNLLDNCSLKNLKYIEIKWTVNWKYLTSVRQELQTRCLKEVLQKISDCSPDVYFLKCQLLGTLDMTRPVVRFKNIQCLVLVFLERENIIDERALQLVTSSLSKLKELKIKVAQVLSDDFKGYSLKSESLEVLEISWCKGFRIRELDLPNLHTFMAVNIFDIKQGRGSPCLFDLISNGCPEITRLNFRRSIISGLDNFPLSEDDEREMNICQCDKHAPWRVQE